MEMCYIKEVLELTGEPAAGTKAERYKGCEALMADLKVGGSMCMVFLEPMEGKSLKTSKVLRIRRDREKGELRVATQNHLYILKMMEEQ